MALSDSGVDSNPDMDEKQKIVVVGQMDSKTTTNLGITTTTEGVAVADCRTVVTPSESSTSEMTAASTSSPRGVGSGNKKKTTKQSFQDEHHQNTEDDSPEEEVAEDDEDDDEEAPTTTTRRPQRRRQKNKSNETTDLIICCNCFKEFQICQFSKFIQHKIQRCCQKQQQNDEEEETALSRQTTFFDFDNGNDMFQRSLSTGGLLNRFSPCKQEQQYREVGVDTSDMGDICKFFLFELVISIKSLKMRF